MKAVVFHGVGDIRLDDVAEPRIEHPNDVPERAAGVEACEAFDRREPGWLEVELQPAGSRA